MIRTSLDISFQIEAGTMYSKMSICKEIAVMSVVLILLLLIPPLNAFAQEDLTGVWSCDDSGTYFIRQVGNTVWWFGQSTSS
jgi:hypothetical protein